MTDVGDVFHTRRDDGGFEMHRAHTEDVDTPPPKTNRVEI